MEQKNLVTLAKPVAYTLESTGLAKKFIPVFPLNVMRKSERAYWPTQKIRAKD